MNSDQLFINHMLQDVEHLLVLELLFCYVVSSLLDDPVEEPKVMAWSSLLVEHSLGNGAPIAGKPA